MAAFIFEAEADEHPPPPVPARVALLGSISSAKATALSIREGMLEKDLIARPAADNSMRGVGVTCVCRSEIEDTFRRDRKHGATDASMTLPRRVLLMPVGPLVEGGFVSQ